VKFAEFGFAVTVARVGCRRSGCVRTGPMWGRPDSPDAPTGRWKGEQRCERLFAIAR
jgi:hypothetical protein